MVKVMQTVTGLGGNCQSATIATLLGLSIEQVPSFWVGTDLENFSEAENGEIFNANVDDFLSMYGFKTISLGADGPHEDWVMGIGLNLPGGEATGKW